MSKRVAILQSNYLPWKGYFDIIGSVDLFVFHDDVQYTKGDWRNRNRIKTAKGLEWITVPCGSGHDRRICDVELKDAAWQRKHWRKLRQEYGRAEFWEYCRPFLHEVYLERQWANLSELNQELIRRVAREFLQLDTAFDDSRKYDLVERKEARVLELLTKVGATEYVSGPAAKAYLDAAELAKAGIGVTWMDYANYPEHRQFHPPFVHQVSIVDLLCHEGPSARAFLTCARRNARGEP